MQTRGHRVKVVFEARGKNMDLPPIANNSIINITCGMLQARLHKERFICPGINRECIEYDGRFITPKTFYVMADKGSLKDWKNAIRINGKKIRRYIDNGELDFYNHEKMCTGRCKSRMGHKTSSLPFDNMGCTDIYDNSSYQSTPKNKSTQKGSKFMSSREGMDTAAAWEDTKPSEETVTMVTDSFGEPQDVKPTADQLSHMMLLNLKPDQNGSETISTAADTSSAAADNTGVHPVQLLHVGEMDNQDDEDTTFWRAIVQLGLIDEFFREIKSKLDELKVNMIKKFVSIDDAKVASLIVNELGMKEKLDMRLFAHKYEFDRQRDKLEKEMEQLKKKVNEYEQKKDMLKRKSDCYEQLMTKKVKYEHIPSTATLPSSSSGHQMVIVNTNIDGSGNPKNSPGMMVKIQTPPSRLTNNTDNLSAATNSTPTGSRTSSPYPSTSQETVIPSSQDTQTGSEDSGESNSSADS